MRADDHIDRASGSAGEADCVIQSCNDAFKDIVRATSMTGVQHTPLPQMPWRHSSHMHRSWNPNPIDNKTQMQQVRRQEKRQFSALNLHVPESLRDRLINGKGSAGKDGDKGEDIIGKDGDKGQDIGKGSDAILGGSVPCDVADILRRPLPAAKQLKK
jgi:hypothetical protein